MSRTVVLRLVDVGADPRLRGVVEDILSGRSHRFTTPDELIALLDRLLRPEPAPSAEPPAAP